MNAPTAELLEIDDTLALCFFTKKYLLSNHFEAICVGQFVGYGQMTTSNSEQLYFMSKAEEFNDHVSFQRIAEATTAAEAKWLGKRIQPFDESRWHAVRLDKMLEALRGKFRPGPLRRALMDTGFLPLVEASGDRFWGAGLEMGDGRLGATAHWRGENALGRALMAVREELRPLPPQPSATTGRYVVCQAAAVDHVVVVAEDPAAQPYVVKVPDAVIGSGRKLQVGDSLEVEAVMWRDGYERLRLTAEGGAGMPGWLFQARLVAQAEATATTGVERGEWGRVNGQVASCVYGGARGNRAVCSVRVRGDGGHLWSLTQRNFGRDLGGMRDQQWLTMAAVTVPAGWRVDWGWVLPSNTRLRESFAWEGWHSDGECLMPVYAD